MKNSTGLFVNNSGGSWSGSLNALDVSQGYIASSSQAATLKVEGRPAQPSAKAITLTANKWSWIGYTPQFSMTVQEALAGIVNPAQTDQIKGQKGYRIMSTNGWVGSLNAMEPGQGYKYRSYNSQNATFYYPSATAFRSAPMMPLPQGNVALLFDDGMTTRAAALNPHWETDSYRYANTMTVTASLLNNGEEVRDGLYEIAAFCGEECRGNAILEVIDGFEHPYMGFLMIFGDEHDALTFHVYDHATGAQYVAKERIDFEDDATLGTPDKTWPVTFNSTTGNDVIDAPVSIYPNPVEKALYINSRNRTLDKVVLVDLTGRIFRIEEDFNGSSLDVSNLAAGMYILKVQVDEQVYVFKFTKK